MVMKDAIAAIVGALDKRKMFQSIGCLPLGRGRAEGDPSIDRMRLQPLLGGQGIGRCDFIKDVALHVLV
jgi:hypothetical protein